MTLHPDPTTRPPQIGPDDCVILFDGVCSLCSSGAQTLLRWDRHKRLKLCSLQSEAGQAILRWCGLPQDDFDTMVFIERGTAHLRSTAALRCARYLPFPLCLAATGLMFPETLRDWIYGVVAGNRYRLFGKRESCMMPTKEVLSRFVT